MIDAEICRLLDQVDDNTCTFIMSDHGFTELKAVFYLNMWLRDRGYLNLKKFNVSRVWEHILSKSGLTRDKIARLLKHVHLDILKRLFPKDKIVFMRRQLPSSKGKTSIVSFIKFVDWNKTKVITVGETCIYINLQQDCREYAKIREELIEQLKTIKDPITGDAIFKDVKRREEVYEGEFTSIAPDLLSFQMTDIDRLIQ